MPDPNRVFAGFVELSGGMDGGRSASLISENQCALATNVTFRGAFPKTRPPYASLPLTFDSATTESRFTGIFQGATFYEAEFGKNGFIVSIGGKLFRIELGQQNIVSEITPTLIIVTTADFTVPALNGTVSIYINSVSGISATDTIYIDSGQYQVDNLSVGQLDLTYLGGAANATAASGTSVLDSAMAQIMEYKTNPSTYDFVYLFQAENYVIVLAGPHKPIIYDGLKARQAGLFEIPPGSLGIYLWGRIWILLPNQRELVAGDIVQGPSGTAEHDYRDAILKFTENTFLNEGGSFSIPVNAGTVNALMALATQDTSLGLGNLLAGTFSTIFSINTPVDRTTWKDLQYPIQTISLLDHGPLSPRGTVPVNGDIWYRATDGERTFISGRREQNTWGHTPMSREISSILEKDQQDLLYYGSAIEFDNKLLMTASPYRSSTGVAHRGLVSINFDLLSNVRSKLPPSWEGLITGLDIFQVLKGNVDDEERGFAFALGTNGVELWEMLRDGDGYYDEFETISGTQTTITRTAIESVIETKSYDSQLPFNLKGLYMGELYVDEIVDDVTIVIKFRPDQYPSWTTWTTINLCANVTQCTVQTPGQFTCSVWKTNQRQYAARLTIPRPPETCNTIAGAPVDRGYEFQYRLEWTGHCRIRRFRAHCKIHSQTYEGMCPENPVCTSFQACDETLFDYDSHGT